MNRISQLRRRFGQDTDRIDKRLLIDGRPALLALIAERSGALAMRTRPANEPVRQKLLGLRVVELLGLPLGKEALLVNGQEKALAELLMRLDVFGLMRAPENVELDPQPAEVVALRSVEVPRQLLDRTVLLPRGLEGGHPVVVAAADESHVVPRRAEIAHVGVGRQIRAGDMPHMKPPVGIGQSGRHEIAFLSHENHNRSHKVPARSPNRPAGRPRFYGPRPN